MMLLLLNKYWLTLLFDALFYTISTVDYRFLLIINYPYIYMPF